MLSKGNCLPLRKNVCFPKKTPTGEQLLVPIIDQAKTLSSAGTGKSFWREFLMSRGGFIRSDSSLGLMLGFLVAINGEESPVDLFSLIKHTLPEQARCACPPQPALWMSEMRQMSPCPASQFLLLITWQQGALAST